MKTINKILFLSLVISLLSCSNAEQTEKNTLPVQTLIGTNIPSLTLDAYHKGTIKKVSLQSYKGKWLILFFYPGDFTFVCPTELRELSQFYEDFRSDNAEVLSISTDSVYVHKAWKESSESLKQVTFPMLSDRTAKLSKALGVYDENTGEALRASFIVNPDGIIVAYEIHDPSIGRSAGELLRKLDAAIAVYKGGGGLCPAGWKKGDPLIKPIQ